MSSFPIRSLMVLAMMLAASSPARSDACSGLHLKIDRVGEDVGNGSRTFRFQIHNIGADACEITGAPAVELFDTRGGRLDVEVISPAAGDKAEPVALAPGADAHFDVEFASPGDRDATCHDAVELRTIMPGTDMPSTFSGSFMSCGPVKVSPIRSGTSIPADPKL